jgi:hypothetical protein
MNSQISPFACGAIFGLIGLLSSPLALSQTGPNCSQIAEDVKAAISKDPSKVLMIVEDALVISESCACEIVKAAIAASSADAAMIRQIVQTGIAVAPKYSAMITECASPAGPIAVAEESPAVESGRNPAGKNPSGKNVMAFSEGGKTINPVMPEVDAEGSRKSTGGPSLYNFSGNVRGVYLVYPAAGVITSSAVAHEDEEDECCGGGSHKPVKRVESRRKCYVVPLSPSEATTG